MNYGGLNTSKIYHIMKKLILRNRKIKSLLKLLYGMIGEAVHRCLFIVNIKSELNWSPVIPGRTKTFLGIMTNSQKI